MKLVADAFSNGAEKAEALALGRKYLSDNDFIDLDYLEICAENLLDQPNTTNARVFIAVTIAGVRLIDNLKIAK
jgi:pantothenate synthetase